MIKTFLIFILVCTLVFPLGLLAKQKRGIDLVVQTKDEQIFQGELITVKQYALLLLSEEGADVTVDIREVRNLTTLKKPKVLKGFGYGALIGGVTLGLPSATAEDNWWIVFASIGAISGAVIGTLFGLAAGRDETILVSTKSDAEIQEILNQLRSKARVTDYY